MKAKQLLFTKMVAAGNDFLIVHRSRHLAGKRLRVLARDMCDRKYGAGADGLLLLEGSRKADVRMRVFNADGSEAQMCGNGARCVARYWALRKRTHDTRRTTHDIKIETRAGIIVSFVTGDRVRIKLTEPKGLEFGIRVKLNTRMINVDYIDTGVPHVVIFVDRLDAIPVGTIAPDVRHHERFAPAGTNVNFVEVRGKNAIGIRTYERGVEAETLACGTGSVAAAVIFAIKSGCRPPVKVTTRSSEVLKVYWSKGRDWLSQVWLEGSARIIYKGEYHYV